MLTSAAEPLLSVEALESGYGKIRVLHGIDFKVAAGEVVALLGPNGAGKTTMLRALSGLLPVNAGQVRFDGRNMTNATPRDAARAGLVHVIDGHRVFTQISVTDNLLLAGYDAGIIERHDFREGRARYEQMRDSHHDHLINLRDGKVIEFTNEEIEKLQAEIARKLGYKLVDHRLELYCVPLDDEKS